MKKLYQGKIPFSPTKKIQKDWIDGHGEFQGWENDKPTRLDWEMRDNIPFSAVLVIEGYSRGRSAANFGGRLKNVTCANREYMEKLEGCEVNIFMSDIIEIIKESVIDNGDVQENEYAFAKRGQNYGLCFISKDTWSVE